MRWWESFYLRAGFDVGNIFIYLSSDKFLDSRQAGMSGIVKVLKFCILLLINNADSMVLIGLIVLGAVVLFGIAAGVAISANGDEK